jgi:hypothetical protein
MKKILWLTDSRMYDHVQLDVLTENGISVDVMDNPDFALSKTEELEKYDYIICTMFLAVGHILDIGRCVDGTKTGIVLFSEIFDKVRNPKLILRVTSYFEISGDEIDWCKSNNITILNDSESHYDTILKLVDAYVPNDVFKYRLSLKEDLNLFKEVNVYVKPFPNPWDDDYDEENEMSLYEKEDFLKEKFFTKEKIQELKNEFLIKFISEENPFDISCIDVDGGYNVTEAQLFKY